MPLLSHKVGQGSLTDIEIYWMYVIVWYKMMVSSLFNQLGIEVIVEQNVHYNTYIFYYTLGLYVSKNNKIIKTGTTLRNHYLRTRQNTYLIYILWYVYVLTQTKKNRNKQIEYCNKLKNENT